MPKKPKCPKCKKAIDYLHVTVLEEYTKSYAGGNGTFDEVDQLGTTMRDWSCPECGHVLNIEGQDDADAFLEGKG